VAAINNAIRQVGINVLTIVAEINKINPNVQIYVMGYYNPFPNMPKEIQPLLNNLVEGLNTSIGTAAGNPNVEFIATKDVIAESSSVYLPNPTNIHLSEAGYQKVAEQFWDKMKNTYPWVSTESLIADVITTNSANLNWQPAIDDVAVTGYEIYNGKDKVATVKGEVLTYKVEKLAESKAYVFSIVAVDEVGNKSVFNPEVKISTLPIPALFTDIAEHWAKKYIEKAATAGLVRGYPDGTFKPDNQLTRAQIATILVRAMNLKTAETSPFGDIGSYAKETQADINAAYKYGLVKGQGSNFMPSKQVSRAQIALMIDRAYTLKTGTKYVVSNKAPFTDFGNYDVETVNAISMLYELGIASGSDGKFMPGNPTTRAHAAKIFINLLDSEK